MQIAKMTYPIHTKSLGFDTNTSDSLAFGGLVGFNNVRGHCSVDAWLC